MYKKILLTAVVNLSISLSSFCGKGNNNVFQDETDKPKKQQTESYPLDWAPRPNRAPFFMLSSKKDNMEIEPINTKLFFSESEDEMLEKDSVIHLTETLEKLEINKKKSIRKIKRSKKEPQKK